MIKNFDEVKKQLGELSDVVNKFKSEQVQLKIVDLIFRNAGLAADDDQPEDPPADSVPPPHRKHRASGKRKAAAKSGDTPNNGLKKAKAKGTGPAAVLQQLLDTNFFDKKRTIGDVMDYCKNKLARNIPMNQLSTPLARFVRDNKLDRSKNAENQYEYTKK